MNRPSFRTRRPRVAIVVAASILLILLIIAVVYDRSKPTPTTEVRINSAVYNLRLADSEAELEKGLSGVGALDSDGGLLMQFTVDNRWGIWMKDMKIPLDIIWLDSAKRVVYIEENVSPQLGTSKIMEPAVPTRYVLELSEGSVKNAGIQVGQQAEFITEGVTR